MHDIIILGGGPAGLTAALYARRNGKTALVLEKSGFGGQATFSPRLENIPGFLSISGNEFADKMLEQILTLDAEVEVETAIEIRDEGSVKRVLTAEGGDYPAKAVIIATGVKHRMLGLPGEDELVGSGISFCAVCDGEYYKSQTVVVAGGGNSALQEATLLAETCREVIIVQDLDRLTGEEALAVGLAKRPNVRILMETTITGLVVENGGLKAVSVRSKTGEESDLPCDGLFVAIGLIPENAAFSPLVSLDSRGYIQAGEDCKTNAPGIFTAGDCRVKTVRQIATAAADGAVAALAACDYIRSLA